MDRAFERTVKRLAVAEELSHDREADVYALIKGSFFNRNRLRLLSHVLENAGKVWSSLYQPTAEKFLSQGLEADSFNSALDEQIDAHMDKDAYIDYFFINELIAIDSEKWGKPLEVGRYTLDSNTKDKTYIYYNIDTKLIFDMFRSNLITFFWENLFLTYPFEAGILLYSKFQNNTNIDNTEKVLLALHNFLGQYKQIQYKEVDIT